jgi:lactate racemase
MHVSTDDASMKHVGTLPSGGPCIVNRKSVLPGISSHKTILANHCAEFINSPHARPGILEGNPIHKDMLHAAKAAGLPFVVNVVLNGDRTIIACFAGDLEKVHLKGCEFLTSLAAVKKLRCDITVATNGGYPLDQNIYQAVKGMTSAEATNKQGGVIIMVGRPRRRYRRQRLLQQLGPIQITQRIPRPSVPYRSQSYGPRPVGIQVLARILNQHHVIMVSDLIQPEIITNMHMEHAKTFDQALRRAYKLQGSAAKVAVIPDGLAVIVR